MPETSEILRQRLEERRAARNISPRALSLAIGANHSYVSQLISGKGGSPSADKLRALARELDTSTEYLTGEANSPDPVLSEVGLSDRLAGFHPAPAAPIPLRGTGDCSEFEVTDESGSICVIEQASFDPEYHIQFIARPEQLRGSPDAYAIDFYGSSMEPRFFAGETGYVDPRRNPKPGDDVVVQINDGHNGDVVAVMVKRLIRSTPAEYQLEQYNPPARFSVPRSRVVAIHRIVMVARD